MKQHAIVRLRRLATRTREIIIKLAGLTRRAGPPVVAERTSRDG
jgi:hypothetical protein